MGLKLKEEVEVRGVEKGSSSPSSPLPLYEEEEEDAEEWREM